MNNVFERCEAINSLLNNNNILGARSEVINLLSELKEENPEVVYTPLLNHLIREVGLLAYVQPNSANWQDRFACEVFKTDVGEEEKKVLHLEQSHILKRLLAGENLAVSAPTSFGKSFIVDAFIAIKKPDIIVLIVPTIALADETRRRLTHKFSQEYKIITTTDATVGQKSIFVFPQERAFAYIPILEHIDVLIVDEFYKASSKLGDERSSVLLSSMIELGKKAKQRYYLAPNIEHIGENAFTEGMSFMKIDFKTVITKVSRVYTKRHEGEDVETFKRRRLKSLVSQSIGKSLIYAGTLPEMRKVCEVLTQNCNSKRTRLLMQFSEWIKKNYGPEYELADYVSKGFGVHNGKLHRSLSQIQVKLFEKNTGLDYLVSTSSIIEGVNTQAENVILWSVKIGGGTIDFFTYRNIIGRAGRAFKYFVGKVYLLEQPPHQEPVELNLDFPDDVTYGIDANDPGIRLDNEQFVKIKKYNDEMEALLGADTWKRLKNNSAIKVYKPTVVKTIAEKIKNDANWPRNFGALAKHNTYDWKEALEDVIDAACLQRKGQLRTFAGIALGQWHMTFQQLYNKVKNFSISYEDMFDFERKISFHLCSLLSLVYTIKSELYPRTPDITPFIHSASNGFLPKLVYQLEEYGLPRMISKKIHVSHVMNLENDDIEIGTVIDRFKRIGYDRLVEKTMGLDAFDKWIIKYFYEGIE